MTHLKRNSFFSILLSVLIALSIILRGGWGSEAILLFFSSVLMIFRTRTRKSDISGCGILIVASLLYVVFGTAASGFSYASFKGVCGILFSLNVLFCVKSDENGLSSFLRGIWCGCVFVCIIGLVGYCGILPFEGCVLDENGFRSFQSVIQYANTAALLMATGYLITIYYNASTPKRVFSIFEVLFIVSAFLTYSKILIFIFTGILIASGYFLKKPELILRTAVNLFLAVLTAVCGVLLYKAGCIGIMVIVIAVAAFVGCKINNIMTGNLKTASKILVLMTTLYVVALILFIIYILNSDRFAASSFVYRLIYMKDACSAIADNPIFGIGTGMWEYRQFAYQSTFYDVPLIHNGFLQIALDAGVVTSGFFVTATVICILKMKKRISAPENVLILLIYILIVLHSILDVNLSFCAVSAIFFGCFGSVGGEKEKRAPLLLPQALICVISLVVLFNQVVYKGVIENGEQKFADIALLTHDSEMYYELSKQSDGENAINLIETAEEINPYDYKLAQAGFALSYEAGDFEQMYDYAFKWVQLQPMNNEAYEAAAFAVYKLYGDETEEKTKLIDIADAVNDKVNKLSDYIEKKTYIDIDNIQKILDAGI